MNLLPKTKEEFSQKEYWDTFFKKRGSKAFEWYGEYPELADNLHKYLKNQDEILITGCGNSNLGKDLYDIGFKNITNIDISQVVIRQMLQNKKDRPNLKYLVMDAINTTFENEYFNVILDKGTLDALMPDDNAETVSKIKKYFDEIQRILKNGGRYICISLLQENILKILLDYFPSNNWMFRAVRCFEAENKAIENGENSMPVFIVICTKFIALPRKILELNLASLNKMERFDKEEDIIQHISSVQHAAFVCSGLKRSSIANEKEVVLDLYEPDNSKPRFTVYVVDIPPQSNVAQYAAFIVPQGRESEWIFSTSAGRKHLVNTIRHQRLAIITLHRGQVYESFQKVQDELTSTVCNLAPITLKNKKIPFLSLGSDVGKRIIKHEGNSEFTGNYVIEDVDTETGKYRRLIYMSSQSVIQSEAKLKSVKSRKGLIREIIDLACLTCKHHIYMSLMAFVACKEREKSSLAVIGLGGGGLCSFLNKFLPRTSLTAIDIDRDMLEIATKWFGFQQNEKLQVKIMDGVKYLKEVADNGKQYEAVLFDIDSKDSSIGMSCPPKEFLEKEVLTNVAKVLGKSGLFILNIVLRDPSLRSGIEETLKKHFKLVISYKLEEDLNEIIICSNTKIILDNLQEGCKQINVFFRKNNAEELVDIEKFMKNLKIDI